MKAVKFDLGFGIFGIKPFRKEKYFEVSNGLEKINVKFFLFYPRGYDKAMKGLTTVNKMLFSSSVSCFYSCCYSLERKISD